ncbi:MAG: hypothetical protein A2287_04795 [Candidatus Melainabacteria bacterium RIFOXYA12_FULL_32_12]|nr:MAG: hypothetical protein A2255_03590 [Candidatus Melainabacteria bacterium RIFOXYA2_FULL_32_9]OGI29833.1 MAG: hypothetical protein A2287_04795 [Candidatus Melainabacteria bacterium RIFOXYA12_FULL_32_12]
MRQCVKEDLNNKSIHSGFINKNSKPVINNKNELKIGIIYSAVALLFAFTLGLLLSGYLIKALQLQVPFTIKFIHFAPDEILVSSLKIAIFFGLYLSFPFIAYQFAKFKFQNKSENRKLFLILVSSGFLLLTFGILFAYYALIPLILFFLLGFNSDLAVTSLSISKYVSFCLNTILISCIAFELPVFLMLLIKTDFIKSKKLTTSWKKVIIGSFIASVFLTSSELFTQIFLTGVILFFYGLGIATTKIIEK